MTWDKGSPECQCSQCEWRGPTNALDGLAENRCPECGSKAKRMEPMCSGNRPKRVTGEVLAVDDDYITVQTDDGRSIPLPVDKVDFRATDATPEPGTVIELFVPFHIAQSRALI